MWSTARRPELLMPGGHWRGASDRDSQRIWSAADAGRQTRSAQETCTLPVKPPLGVTVTVDTPLLPAVTVKARRLC